MPVNALTFALPREFDVCARGQRGRILAGGEQAQTVAAVGDQVRAAAAGAVIAVEIGQNADPAARARIGERGRGGKQDLRHGTGRGGAQGGSPDQCRAAGAAGQRP